MIFQQLIGSVFHCPRERSAIAMTHDHEGAVRVKPLRRSETPM